MAVQRQGKFRWRAISDQRKECGEKTRWASEESAQRVASRIRREEGTSRMDTLVRPYRCVFCKRWHLGHGM